MDREQRYIYDDHGAANGYDARNDPYNRHDPYNRPEHIALSNSKILVSFTYCN